MSSQAVAPTSPTGSTTSAGRVLIVGLIALVLGALLNADSLVAQAERKPFGWSRDLSLAVWEPVQSVSHFLSLNRPREWIDSMTGRADSRPGEGFEFPPTDPRPEAPGTGDPSPPPPDVPLPEPELRTPTADDPLRVWVGGDSMAQVFGQSLVAFVGDTDLMTGNLDYRISTGLTRPDYFNWPQHLLDEIDRMDPDALVIMFGANDAQGLVTDDGEVFQEVLSDGWAEEYRRRVAGTMDLLEDPDRDRIVYWVGQPAMRSAGFDGRMRGLNEIYQQEAESRPWVRFIDSYELFTNDAGQYEAFLPGIDGRMQDLRQGDGIHLSRAGGDLLARTVLDLIEADARMGD